MNAVHLVGRLAGDPRRGRGREPWTTLRVTVPRRAGEGGSPLYIDVVSYGRQAVDIGAADLRRGRLVAVTGRLEEREAIDDARSPHYVVASQVDFLDVAGRSA